MSDTLLRWFAAMLCIAGLTHIGAILVAPSQTHDRAFIGVDLNRGDGRLVQIDEGDTIANLDPAFVNAICRFDSETGPVRLSGTMPDTYWSIAATSNDGRILSSMSREDLRGAEIDLLVGRTTALDTTRQSAGIDTIETMSLPVDTGFVLLRLFAGDIDDRDRAEKALENLKCGAVL